MASLDVHVFAARAVADAESKYTPSGKQVATFSLALGRGKDQTGAEQTIYPDFVGYGDTAQKLVEKIRKGSKVVVSKAILAIRSWQGQDGVKRTKVEFIILSPNDFYVEWTPDQATDGAPVATATQAPATQVQTPRQKQGFRTGQQAQAQAASRQAVRNNEPIFDGDDADEYI